MSKINLKFAELHSALFLGGKNFGLKLDLKRFSDLKLVYDRAEKELLVTWGDEVGIIPASNVVAMIEGGIEVAKPATTVQGAFKSAQVQTPMSHVHAGPGHGKSK